MPYPYNRYAVLPEMPAQDQASALAAQNGVVAMLLAGHDPTAESKARLQAGLGLAPTAAQDRSVMGPSLPSSSPPALAAVVRPDQFTNMEDYLRSMLAANSQPSRGVLELRGTAATNPIEAQRSANLDYYLQQMSAFQKLKAMQEEAAAQTIHAKATAAQAEAFKDPGLLFAHLLEGRTVPEAKAAMDYINSLQGKTPLAPVAPPPSPETSEGKILEQAKGGGVLNLEPQSGSQTLRSIYAANPGYMESPTGAAAVRAAMPGQTTALLVGGESPAQKAYASKAITDYRGYGGGWLPMPDFALRMFGGVDPSRIPPDPVMLKTQMRNVGEGVEADWAREQQQQAEAARAAEHARTRAAVSQYDPKGLAEVDRLLAVQNFYRDAKNRSSVLPAQFRPPGWRRPGLTPIPRGLPSETHG